MAVRGISPRLSAMINTLTQRIDVTVKPVVALIEHLKGEPWQPTDRRGSLRRGSLFRGLRVNIVVISLYAYPIGITLSMIYGITLALYHGGGLGISVFSLLFVVSSCGIAVVALAAVLFYLAYYLWLLHKVETEMGHINHLQQFYKIDSGYNLQIAIERMERLLLRLTAVYAPT